VSDDDQARTTPLCLGDDGRIGYVGEVDLDIDSVGIEVSVLTRQLDESLAEIATQRHLTLGVALGEMGKDGVDRSWEVNHVHHEQPCTSDLRSSPALAQGLDCRIAEIAGN
jgi:hypothetical protein